MTPPVRDWRPGPIAYGADYNPEQWPEETRQEDLRLMREAHVNFVTPAVFSWARLQPEKDRWDFTWLDEVLDALHDEGIAVDLATATASPPAWLAREHPDSLPVDARGHRLSFGSRQQYCPSSPDFQRAALTLTTRMAQRYGTHPALKLWHVSNEYACHVWECFCPRCCDRFRDHLADEYGTIEALNEAWYTSFWSQSYTDFSQIGAPQLLPSIHNPAQMLDWTRFSHQQILRLFTAEAETLRRLTPSIPVTTNFMGDFIHANYAEWAPHVDVVADDHYPDPADPSAPAQVAYMADLMRSLGTERVGTRTPEGLLEPRPRAFLLMEQTSNHVQWRLRNAGKAPGVFRLWSIARWARGADGICQFQWRASTGGSEAFHAAMVPHAGRASRTWREVVDLGATLSSLPAAGDVDWPLASVAIVMDWESEWARRCSVGLHDALPFGAVRAWHRACSEGGLSVDLVRPGTDLSGYRLVIVPELFATRPDFALQLRAACEAGSVVLVTGPTAYQGLDSRVHCGGYLGDLAEVLGVRITEFWTGGVVADPFYPVASSEHENAGSPFRAAVGQGGRSPALLDWASPAMADAFTCDATSFPVTCGDWAEELDLATDTEVVAVYAPGGAVEVRAGGTACRSPHFLEGMPALTRRRVGAGRAWYLGAGLHHAGRRRLIDLLAGEAGVRPVVTGLPEGTEAVGRPDGTVVLLNHTDTPQMMYGREVAPLDFALIRLEEANGRV